MRMIGKYRKSILVNISLEILLAILMMGVVVSLIGYQLFSVKMTEKYREDSILTAKTAAKIVDADRVLEDYADGGQSEEFRETQRRLDWMTEFQDVTFIFVLLVDRDDYGTTYYLYDSVNPNWSQFPRRGVGFVEKTINEEYEQAYRDLYNGRRESATVMMKDDGNVTGAHFTSMVPLKDSSGETVGIMCVHQQISKIHELTEKYLRTVGSFSIVLGLLASLIIMMSLYHSMIRPLQKITDETRRFSARLDLPETTLQEAVNIQNEIGILAMYVDQMERKTVDSINRMIRISAEKERMGAELNIANSIQSGILPHVFPPFPDCPEIDLYASMDPAREVGGDFYDFFFVDPTHLAMVVADVSGKGVPAALFMMVSKSLIKARTMEGGSPSQILESINNQLCDGNGTEMFTTAWLGILDLETGTLTTASAGHEYPAMTDEHGQFYLVIDHHGFVLGGMEGMKYTDETFTLPEGGKCFVYTDGLAEAMNSRKEMFGTDRLIDTLNKAPEGSARELLTYVRGVVDEFVQEEPQFDDLTMMCMYYKGKNRNTFRDLPQEETGRGEERAEGTGKALPDRVPSDNRKWIRSAENREEKLIMRFVREKIPARRDLMDYAQELLTSVSGNWKATSKELMQAEIALEELFVNIASYAYPDGEGELEMEIGVSEDGKEIRMVLKDQGIPFNPLKRTREEAVNNLKKMLPGGLGIYLVQQYADELDYRYENEQNIITFVKRGTAED